MRASSPFLLALAALALVPSVHAAPKSAPSLGKGRAAVFAGGPTAQRGSLTVGDATIPSAAERAASYAAITGDKTVLGVAWASVTVRSPQVANRAALVFADAQVVDAKRGLARWGVEAMLPSLDALFCSLFGCPGGQTSGSIDARGLQLWVKATAGKRYLVDCRVDLDDAVGAVKVVSDGGFDMTTQIDHTGKSFGRVGFLLDPDAGGWYGFSIATGEAWSSSGCTVDEVE